MTLAGHSLAHLPQPMHLSLSTRAAMPRTTDMARIGHTLTQQPQATHESASTRARRRFFLPSTTTPPKAQYRNYTRLIALRQ